MKPTNKIISKPAYYRKVDLLAGLTQYKFRMLIINPDDLPNIIEIDQCFQLCCINDHIITAPVNILSQCQICAIDRALGKRTNIHCVINEYVQGQTKFEYKCDLGHHFITNVTQAKHGCASCRALNTARIRHSTVGLALNMDKYILHVHDNTRLRFHCNKIRHDPECSNPICEDMRENPVIHDREYDEHCKNFIACNQDFYATYAQILKWDTRHNMCRFNHHWEEKTAPVLNAVRVFETYFDCRFDDNIYYEGIEFTGYNRELSIAFTHGADTIPQKSYAARNAKLNAVSWCVNHNVRFVYIGAKTIKSSHVAITIMEQLDTMGLLTQTVVNSVKNVRTIMKARNAAGQPWLNRCVFDVPEEVH